MTACTELVLERSELSGTIPTELGSMTSLESQVRLKENKFDGEFAVVLAVMNSKITK